jgi:signal transduction histidine kinase
MTSENNIDLKEFYQKRTIQLEDMVFDLKQINENKNLFLGLIAHDLRSPLNKIYGYTSLMHEYLKQDVYDKHDIVEKLDKVQLASQRMSRMINELLNFSKMETGDFNVELKKISMSDLLTDRFEYFKNRAKHKAIQFDVIIEPGIEEKSIFADLDKLVDVLENLIDNAIKYTNSGGRVIVSFMTMNGHIKIIIEDNGQGFEEKELDYLYKPFKTFSSKPTAGEVSTGLGLLIVKKIIDLHDYTLRVQSKKHTGTRFEIDIEDI